MAISLGPVTAQTNVSGLILTNVTWTLEGSPYIVTDDLVVFETATLTIEPGVTVRVANAKSIELRNGRLVAIGTADAPITFTGTTGQWDGIVVRGFLNLFNGDNQVEMHHCIARQAIKFMDLDEAYHTPYNFISCEFLYNNTAVTGSGGSYQFGRYNFEDCTFRNNHIALHESYTYSIQGCTFVDNLEAVDGAGHLVGCTFSDNDFALRGGRHVDGNIFTGNTIAVEGYWASETPVFTNNTIIGNGIGIRMLAMYNDTVQFTGNRICDNTEWNIQRVLGNPITADIRGTCFCTDDLEAIEATIFHAVDNIAMGLILFDPVDTDAACVGVSTHLALPTVEEWSIHPNPSDGQLTITLPPGLRSGTLALYDATGRLVRFAPVAETTNRWNVEDLPNGPFKLVLRSAEHVLSSTVVVTH